MTNQESDSGNQNSGNESVRQYYQDAPRIAHGYRNEMRYLETLPNTDDWENFKHFRYEESPQEGETDI